MKKITQKRPVERNVNSQTNLDPKKKEVIRDIQKVISDYENVLSNISKQGVRVHKENNVEGDEEDSENKVSISSDESEDEKEPSSSQEDEEELNSIQEVSSFEVIRKRKVESCIRKIIESRADLYNKQDKLVLVLTRKEDCKILKKLLKKLSGCILPNCKLIRIDATSLQVDNINELLSNHFPNKAKKLIFKAVPTPCRISKYWPPLREISSRQITQLTLTNFIVPTEYLKNIFEVYFELTVLVFW
ncbi:unnamed protein product [Moneuplotes crassus]|uniref:Uncharacterized protein n=1 Tax=Euplotes crassus TaxID=5936 RepID=A0AAD1UI61_EUPCR|nr:unnamed protein product [Moneuplotes crassus]